MDLAGRAAAIASSISVSSGVTSCAPCAEVHLEPVVLRRVVRRGDLHAGGRGQLPDGERGQRGGQRPGREQHRKARRGKHSGRVGGEFGGPVTAVEADHHGLAAMPVPAQVRGDARRGAADHGQVHPGRPGPQRPAEPCGAEGERRPHPVLQVNDRVRPAGHRIGQHPLQLGPVDR